MSFSGKEESQQPDTGDVAGEAANLCAATFQNTSPPFQYQNYSCKRLVLINERSESELAGGCRERSRRIEEPLKIEMMSGGGGEDGLVIENENKRRVQKVDEEVRPLPPAFTPPTDLITRIFTQLDCIDLLHCSLVCRQWYTDSAELREGWKSEYLESCNMFGLGPKRETHPPSSSCSIRGLHSWCP